MASLSTGWEGPEAYHARDALVGPRKLGRVWAVVSWGVPCQCHHGRMAGSVTGYGVLGFFVSGLPWWDGWNWGVRVGGSGACHTAVTLVELLELKYALTVGVLGHAVPGPTWWDGWIGHNLGGS